MSGAAACLCFFSAVNQISRFACFPCYESRENFCYACLFRTKTAADTRFCDTDFGFGNIQRMSNDSSYMEYDLCCTEDIQSAVCVQICVSTECFHHRLAVCLCMICSFQHYITVCHNGFNIAMTIIRLCAEVSFIICTNGTMGDPVIFRMHQNFIVFRCAEIQDCRQYIIFNFDHFQSFVYCFFIFTCNDCNDITMISYMSVQDQTIVRAGFRICLTSHCEAFLRNIFVCVNCFDTGYAHGDGSIDFFNDRICMRAVQQFYYQCIFRHHITCINRFTSYQLHSIFFTDGLIYKFHISCPLSGCL